MKNESLNENLQKLKAYAKRMPKTIAESLEFENNDNTMNDNMENFSHVDNKIEQPSNTFNVEEFVDNIRKQALKGMAMLADKPESADYQILKRIWQICDKKVDDNQTKGAMPK